MAGVAIVVFSAPVDVKADPDEVRGLYSRDRDRDERVPASESTRVAAAVSGYAEVMGLLELLIIILVLAAIFGGIAVSPLLFVLLIVVLVILFTRGGFGYRRGGRL